MILNRSCEEPDIDDPTEGQIIDELERLLKITEWSGEEFVVLADGRYGLQHLKYGPSLIQVVGSPAGWIVEYRDGPAEKLYRAPRGLERQRLVELFLQFARNDDSYRSSVDWKDVTDR